MDWSWVDWAVVLALGGVVGASELISRYKDDPRTAIQGWPAILYIAINGAASVGALGFIHGYSLCRGPSPSKTVSTPASV